MDFVHPALLGGAALAAAPIILHLVMRQKPKRFEFPALRFVRQRREANQRRLRLRHWFLLALRVAVICLLALALARPTMQAGNSGAVQGPVAAALVFDTAPRMGYRHENNTRLQLAQQIARELLRDFPEDSNVAILDARGQPGAFQIDLAAADDRIARLELTPTAQPLLQALEEAVRLLGTSPLERKEIYIFTDLAAVAWSSELPDGWLNQLDALRGLGLYVVDVGIASPNNVSLGELRLSASVVSQTSPLRISTDVACRGAGGERVVVLELLDADGKPQKRNQAVVELTDRQPQRVEFTLAGLPRGTHQGQVRVLGSDGLASDDVRYFTVDVEPPWRIVIAAPHPAARLAAYLSEALAPEQFRKQGLSRFDYEIVDTQDLQRVDLGGRAAVFLLDPPNLPLASWQRLADFAQAGGGVGVFLGDRAAPAEAFNQSLAGLLQFKLSQQRTGPTHLALTGRDHPMLAKFKPLGDEVPWDAFPIYHYWQLSELPEGTVPVVRYANGDAAIVEQPLGRGRVLLATTSISDPPDKKPEPWSRLLTGLRPWPFFMLVNEMALYLAGSGDSELNYLVGQPVTLRLKPDQRVANYLLSTPGNDQIRGAVAGRNDVITVAMTDMAGHYRLRAGGAAGVDRGFSVNLSTDATSLQRAAPDDLKRVFGQREFRLAHNAQDISRVVRTGRIGHELFPFLIVAVAVAVGLEQIVANRFYRKES